MSTLPSLDEFIQKCLQHDPSTGYEAFADDFISLRPAFLAKSSEPRSNPTFEHHFLELFTETLKLLLRPSLDPSVSHHLGKKVSKRKMSGLARTVHSVVGRFLDSQLRMRLLHEPLFDTFVRVYIEVFLFSLSDTLALGEILRVLSCCFGKFEFVAEVLLSVERDRKSGARFELNLHVFLNLHLLSLQEKVTLQNEALRVVESKPNSPAKLSFSESRFELGLEDSELRTNSRILSTLSKSFENAQKQVKKKSVLVEIVARYFGVDFEGRRGGLMPDLDSGHSVLHILHSEKFDFFLNLHKTLSLHHKAVELKLSLLAAFELLMVMSAKLMDFGLFLIQEKKPKFLKIKQRIALFLRHFVTSFDQINHFLSRELEIFKFGSEREFQIKRATSADFNSCGHFAQDRPQSNRLRRSTEHSQGPDTYDSSGQQANSVWVAGFRICYFCLFRREVPESVDRILSASLTHPQPQHEHRKINQTLVDSISINQFLLQGLLGSRDRCPDQAGPGAIRLVSFERNFRRDFQQELVIEFDCPESLYETAKSDEFFCLRWLCASAFARFVRFGFPTVEKSVQFLCLLGSSASSSSYLKTRVTNSLVQIVHANPRVFFFDCVIKVFTLKIQLFWQESAFSSKGSQP